MPRISKTAVDGAKPDPNRDVILWDNRVAGFGLRIKPSGAKSYILQYRNAGGRSRRFTICRVGEKTPDEVRGAAERLKGKIREGADPASERTAQREAATVKELAKRYMRQHVETHNKPS